MPHFKNIDEDPFRSNRFCYMVDAENVVFGPDEVI